MIALHPQKRSPSTPPKPIAFQPHLQNRSPSTPPTNDHRQPQKNDRPQPQKNDRPQPQKPITPQKPIALQLHRQAIAPPKPIPTKPIALHPTDKTDRIPKTKQRSHSFRR